MSFDSAFRFVQRWEGGLVNHPNDPGGLTNQGVTDRYYRAWREQQGLPARSVAQATQEEIREIYEFLWRIRSADLEKMKFFNCAFVVFDFYVQSGQTGGNQLLQRALGNLAVDGIWGPRTWEALEVSVQQKGELATAIRIASERVVFRGERVAGNRAQQVFLLGWLRRDADLLRQLR